MTRTGPKIELEKIKNSLRSFCENPGLRLIILFGSAAADRMHKHSDIDLAFLLDDVADTVEIANRASRLLRTDRIDVVDLRKASPSLKYAIARTGVPIYEREEGLFNEFCSLAFRRYVDTSKLREAKESYIHDYLIEKGLS